MFTERVDGTCRLSTHNAVVRGRVRVHLPLLQRAQCGPALRLLRAPRKRCRCMAVSTMPSTSRNVCHLASVCVSPCLPSRPCACGNNARALWSAECRIQRPAADSESTPQATLPPVVMVVLAVLGRKAGGDAWQKRRHRAPDHDAVCTVNLLMARSASRLAPAPAHPHTCAPLTLVLAHGQLAGLLISSSLLRPMGWLPTVQHGSRRSIRAHCAGAVRHRLLLGRSRGLGNGCHYSSGCCHLAAGVGVLLAPPHALARLLQKAPQGCCVHFVRVRVRV